MKKTLTVNLGGTVFHIDDDAYRLLDNYLNNLKLHFSKEAGADEIVDDIEHRISELFSERIQTGMQVITIADVEEVIARMGKPEEMETDDDNNTDDKARANQNSTYTYSASRRLFRNPEDKMLGGVVSGLAAYLGWDVTLLRLVLVLVLILGYGTLIPVYIVCWLVVPEARTAAEKLIMRGEPVTVENIGRTVTDGFERVASGVNSYIHSDKPRTLMQRMGDGLVMIVGWFLKLGLVVLALICSPLLLALGILFVVLLFASIVIAIGGSAALISLLPMEVSVWLPDSSLTAIVMYGACALLACISLFAIVWAICRQVFRWRPMVTGAKWALLLLWLISLVAFAVCFVQLGYTFPIIGFSV